ncbi:hypothetical protein [Allocoleopsis sp.]
MIINLQKLYKRVIPLPCCVPLSPSDHSKVRSHLPDFAAITEAIARQQ